MQGIINLPQVQVDAIYSAHARTFSTGDSILANAHGGQLFVAVCRGQVLVCADEQEMLMTPNTLLLLNSPQAVRINALTADAQIVRLAFASNSTPLSNLTATIQPANAVTKAAITDLWAQINLLRRLRDGKPTLMFDQEIAEMYQLASSLLYVDLTQALLQCAASRAATRYDQARAGVTPPPVAAAPSHQSANQLYQHIVINQVIDYLQAHLSQRLQLTEIAAHCGVGITTLKRQFKADTGQSVMAYFKAAKLKEAAHLLETTTIPIAEIAAKLAFSSLPHFSGAFKAAYHLSPTEFRTKHTVSEANTFS